MALMIEVFSTNGRFVYALKPMVTELRFYIKQYLKYSINKNLIWIIIFN